jgi:hypothetical protein
MDMNAAALVHEQNMKNLRKARVFARKHFNMLRSQERCHPSFLAERSLIAACEKFNISHYGVEGWCDELGRHGVQYLNMGDVYELTLAYDSKKDRFSVTNLVQISA